MVDSFEKPMGLLGFEFVEFASPTPGVLEPIFEQMGFTLVARHRSKDVVLYRQGDINFIINREPKSFAGYFAAEHGPCACGMAFRVKDSHLVYERALALGAQPMELRLPAIKGIGGAPLYLISRAMTAPDGKIRIPLNEESGKGSGQIEEFLMQFNGEGIQHIAFKVQDRATLLEFRAHLKAHGVNVLGVTDHGLFHSIYFFDPNGHRLELSCPDPDEEAMQQRMDAVKWDMLEEWSQTKRAPKHAAFLHAREFKP